MPSYEFLADQGLRHDSSNFEADIRNILNRKAAPLPVRAQLLNTGIKGQNDRDRNDSLVKNGEPKGPDKGRNGYPELFSIGEVSSLTDDWTAFQGLLAPPEKMPTGLPTFSCLVRVELRLERPYFSRDDRIFLPTENALKREWVFRRPYLASSGIKGLVRWASSALGHGNGLQRKLFGPEADQITADSPANQGLVRFWPIFWEGKCGLEVINPHGRESCVGTNPIKFEVVNPGAKGVLGFLLFNPTGDKDLLKEHLEPLLNAVEALVEDSGLSAKRAADWGQVSQLKCTVWISGMESFVGPGVGPCGAVTQDDAWSKFLDGNGELIADTGNPNTTKYTNANIATFFKAFGRVISNSQMTKTKAALVLEIQQLYSTRNAAPQAKGDAPAKAEPILEHSVRNIEELLKFVKRILSEGGA